MRLLNSVSSCRAVLVRLSSLLCRLPAHLSLQPAAYIKPFFLAMLIKPKILYTGTKRMFVPVSHSKAVSLCVSQSIVSRSPAGGQLQKSWLGLCL